MAALNATRKGPKEVDEMDLVELVEMLKVFGLRDKKLGEAEARSLIKGKIEANKSQEKVSIIVSDDAKREYDRKRKMLLGSYTACKEILTQACKESAVLQEYIGNFEKRIEQLEKPEYFLLVTGETSAGKSSLINLLLKDEIFPTGHAKVTSTIWEIRYGEQPKMKAHLKSEDPETEQPTEEIPLKDPSGSESSEPSYLEQISPFASENGSRCEKIELFLPHSLLKQGIVIVDSPGLGESQDLDDKVYHYLPRVFAFIFVLSVANSDGINNDTVRKLFEMVKKAFGVVKKETGENCCNMQEVFLSECSLFVSNKWDGVEESEIQRVEELSITKLKGLWPGFDSKSQFLRMSVKHARIAQQYKVMTDQFDSLMNGLEGLLTKRTNARLELDWRWLNDALFVVTAEAKTCIKTISAPRNAKKEKLKKLKDALEYIQNHEKERMRTLYRNFKKFEEEAVNRLCDYLSSPNVNSRFTNWTEPEVPPANKDWKTTKQSIEKALNKRLREALQLWLENDMLMAKAKGFLNEELERLFDLPDHLKALPEGDSPEINSQFRYLENWSNAGLFWGATFALMAVGAYFLGPFASLAVRAGVTAIPATLSALGLSVGGFERLEAGWKKSEFEDNRVAFMLKHSRDFLVQSVKENQVPKEFVELQLIPVKQYLSKFRYNLFTLILAERRQLSQLDNEERLSEKVPAYKRISEKGSRLRGDHAVLGIKEMCPSIQIRYKLEFKERIGSGTFGDVYEGKMWVTQNESKPVALKVCKEEPHDAKASEIMDEIETLRKLSDDSHIVQFHGISFHHEKVVLIFEKCTGSLAGKIFNSKEKTLVSESTKVQWAREIIDGLVFIHAENVVHRDLKPQNILLSEENRIKIADLGVAKPVKDVTGTVAGTYFYMAPEVYDGKMYDKKADIYSLGIVLWEMWYGRQAYQWSGTIQEFFDWLKKGNRPEHKGSSDDPPWRDLMMKCWDGNPETRPTALVCKDEIESVCMILKQVV